MPEVRFVATIGKDQLIRLPVGISLPTGEVAVEIKPLASHREAEPDDVAAAEAKAVASLSAMLLGLAAEAERIAPPLPADMAANHDHYAHGNPLP